MKVTIDELRKGISTFLEYFTFEIFDSTTTECLEHQIGEFMKMSEIDDYDIMSTVLDNDNLKINLIFDDNNIDFMIARG